MTNASARLTPRGRRGFIAGVVAVVCGVFAPAALASQPPHPVYTPNGGLLMTFDGITLSQPDQLAVNQTGHTLLVADHGLGHVGVFSYGIDPGTGSPTMTAQPSVGDGVLTTPYGIAVDQSAHRLYVSDDGANRIARYTFSTADPAVFTADPTFVSPTLGSGPGQIGSFSSYLAVDPVTHDLLVADTGNHEVSRYSPTGAFIRSFDGSTGSDGTFKGRMDISVGTDGTVSVTDVGTSPSDLLAAFSGPAHFERFTATGASLGDLDGLGLPQSIGMGSQLGLTFIGGVDGEASNLHSFIGDDPAQSFPNFDTSGAASGHPASVAVDDGPTGNLYVSITGLFGTGGVLVFPPNSVPAPGVSVAAPSATTQTSSHLSATVDAGDAAETASTRAHFQYYTTDSAHPTVLPDVTLSGAGANAVSADLTGLRPNMTYHVQVLATRTDDFSQDPSTADPNGVLPPLPYAHTYSRVVDVTTPGSAPAVVEPAVSDIGTTAATLPGRIDPFGMQGSYHFEYGLTDAYGSRSPAVDAVLGAPAAPTPVDVGLTGLAPGATYHYRLVAVNAVGTTFGSDRQFTTDPVATLAAPRAYEQVTPVDKGGSLMNAGADLVIQSDGGPDGPQIQYGTFGALPGATVAPGNQAIYEATRGADEWTSKALDVAHTLPADTVIHGTTVISGTSLLQRPENFAQSLVYSDRALTPGAVAGRTNLYVQDNSTGALRFLAALDRQFLANLDQSANYILAADVSFNHVYLGTEQVGPIADQNEIFELHDGQATLVSLLPNGTPVDFASAPLQETGTGPVAPLTYGQITTPSGDAVLYSSSTEGAFINRGGQVTPISVSERPGDPSTPQPVYGAEFTDDGNAVIFVDASGTPLTVGGGTEPGSGLYEYTLDAPAGHRLQYLGGYGGNRFDVLRASADGSTVVFSGLNGLVAWRNGHRTVLSATFNSAGDDSASRVVSLSPNGRYVAIKKAEALTDDPIVNAQACGRTLFQSSASGRCGSVYLFDIDGGTVACASCPADGSPPAGDAQMGQQGVMGQTVTDAGEVFFDTPTQLVGADHNADSDVYAYQAGRVRLISRGTAGTQSVLGGVMPGGHDVFFFSDDKLVSQDTDNAVDLYDARLGEGLAAQSPAPDQTAPCAGTECRKPAPGPPAGTSAGAPSETIVSASATSPPGTARAKVTTAKVVLGASTLRLAVHATSRGELRISGRYLRTQTRSVAAPGTYTIRVALTHAAQRLHRIHRQLQVAVRVSLTPPSGAVAVAKLTRTLRG